MYAVDNLHRRVACTPSLAQDWNLHPSLCWLSALLLKALLECGEARAEEQWQAEHNCVPWHAMSACPLLGLCYSRSIECLNTAG